MLSMIKRNCITAGIYCDYVRHTPACCRNHLHKILKCIAYYRN